MKTKDWPIFQKALEIEQEMKEKWADLTENSN
jgi:hypothetical protein